MNIGKTNMEKFECLAYVRTIGVYRHCICVIELYC